METELERLRKKVENFPSASLYNRLAELARLAGDAAEAEAVCRRCVKEFPRSGQAYVILAELKAAQGKKPEAVQLLQQGIEKDPRSYAAHRLMADLADTKELAIHHLKQILGFKPGDGPTIQRIQELGGTVATAAIGSGSGTSHRIRPAAGTPGAAPAPVSTTTTVRPSVVPKPPDANAPLPFPSSSQPPVGTVTTLLRQISGPKTAILDALCMEAGVRGACVVDAQGRVVMAKNLPQGQDELLAALSADIFKAAAATLVTTGANAAGTWVLGAAGGQVLTFSRDRSVSVVVLADPGVRPAMLELRARQALIDLGGA